MGNSLSSVCFKALSEKKVGGQTQLMQGLFWRNPQDDRRERQPRPRTTHGKSNHFKSTVSFFMGFSPPSVSHIIMSFPAVTPCLLSSPIQLLGTEAFVLSYSLAPSRKTLHGYPQGALIFLLQSSPPEESDYGAYKHSIVSSAPLFSLTF